MPTDSYIYEAFIEIEECKFSYIENGEIQGLVIESKVHNIFSQNHFVKKVFEQEQFEYVHKLVINNKEQAKHLKIIHLNTESDNNNHKTLLSIDDFLENKDKFMKTRIYFNTQYLPMRLYLPELPKFKPKNELILQDGVVTMEIESFI